MTIYEMLMTKKYSSVTERPIFDQDLWGKALVVKQNYVTGKGTKRSRTLYTSRYYGSSSLYSHCTDTAHTHGDCIATFCSNSTILKQLDECLKRLNNNVLKFPHDKYDQQHMPDNHDEL